VELGRAARLVTGGIQDDSERADEIADGNHLAGTIIPDEYVDAGCRCDIVMRQEHLRARQATGNYIRRAKPRPLSAHVCRRRVSVLV